MAALPPIIARHYEAPPKVEEIYRKRTYLDDQVWNAASIAFGILGGCLAFAASVSFLLAAKPIIVGGLCCAAVISLALTWLLDKTEEECAALVQASIHQELQKSIKQEKLTVSEALSQFAALPAHAVKSHYAGIGEEMIITIARANKDPSNLSEDDKRHYFKLISTIFAHASIYPKAFTKEEEKLTLRARGFLQQIRWDFELNLKFFESFKGDDVADACFRTFLCEDLVLSITQPNRVRCYNGEAEDVDILRCASQIILYGSTASGIGGVDCLGYHTNKCKEWLKVALACIGDNWAIVQKSGLEAIAKHGSAIKSNTDVLVDVLKEQKDFNEVIEPMPDPLLQIIREFDVDPLESIQNASNQAMKIGYEFILIRDVILPFFKSIDRVPTQADMQKQLCEHYIATWNNDNESDPFVLKLLKTTDRGKRFLSRIERYYLKQGGSI